MPRAMWRGAIQFGLVTVPVKLYLATEARAGLSFNLLHKDCGQRIQMKTHCPEHGEITRSDTVRGFEYSKGQYVVIDEADFENVPLKTVRAIEIELKDREALAALNPYSNTMLLTTLYWPDEVRSTAELELPEEEYEFKPAEKLMAQQLVQAMRGDFEADQYKDDYRQ